jgi:hypothetical protein
MVWSYIKMARELEMISVTTITNIISLVQFSLMPLTVANAEAAAREEAAESGDISVLDRISRFTSLDLSWMSRLFNAPLEFVQRFEDIATLMRVLLFAAIMFGILTLLIVSLFLRAWRLILFCLDFFLPGLGVFGALWFAKGYEEERLIAVTFLVLGLLYLIARVGSLLYPILRKTNQG